ncbi:MAG: peptidoglycan DD-metalloendopeptidase family protein [Planctomycetes bacterium]|nr:peptidoglycan DD-metalloendopeptidase family protein [Planctomycetota bacterium]
MTRTTALLLLTSIVANAGGWGADVNSGAGGPLVEGVRGDLAAIVRAPEAERAALAKAYAAKKGAENIEAVKRFRNPELKPLFLELLRQDDWKTKHRALHVLEYYGEAAALPDAWALLEHPQARLREKAAIFCLKVWDPARAKGVAGGKPAEALAGLAAKEEDFHVRMCLDALAKRIAGRLAPEKVSTEFTVTGLDALVLTPFLDGSDKLPTVAPGYTAKPVPRQGGGSASSLPAAARWAYPILGWGKEEVQGTLQPFANLRQNGTVYHTGQDVGCSLDGAGYYAIADGVVKFVHTGSDMGTLIVVEHNTGDGDLANALYMHGGDTVFVKAGDKVACGQLLGAMGLSYSIENGGHFAHLHFGLYPGPFNATHNFGYRAVSAGLGDWHDPAKWLPERIERTRPLVSARAAGVLGDLLEREEYGKAHAEATKAGEGKIAGEIEAAAGEALKRAEARRDAGYPRDALDGLKKWAGRFKGVPGGEKLDEAAKGWEKDAAFKKALAGEKEILGLEAQLAAKKATPEQAKGAWEGVLKKYGDTVLKGRIEAKVDAK